MKVRSLPDLEDRLDDEVAWRKQELSSFHLVIDDLRRARKRSDERSILRGSIALLYAHWEGLVKESTYLYLSYVSTKKVPIAALSCDIAPAIIGHFKDDLLFTGDFNAISEFARIIRGSSPNHKRLNIKKHHIDTGANLNYKAFIRLAQAAGLETDRFRKNEGFENLVDEQLLARRNKIAHGERSFVDFEEYSEVRDEVLQAMDDYIDVVIKAASDKNYLAENSPE